jgi:DNA-binding NarL/FixJ family response regulator
MTASPRHDYIDGHPQPVAATATLRAADRQTVLIASDDPETRGYLRECLRICHDMMIIELTGVEQTLAWLSQRTPHVVISDMPALIAAPAVANVPLVAMVDVLPRYDEPRARRCTYLVRPCTAQSIRTAAQRGSPVPASRRALARR